MVIDDLLSPQALRELQSYAAHGCHFRSMRAGYLGAFPTDGALHPLLIEVAAALAGAPRRTSSMATRLLCGGYSNIPNTRPLASACTLIPQRLT